MSTENININVGKQGLSYAIDKKLDETFKKDVKLNLSEWKSVFDCIKNDQVNTNKSQFGNNDTDIQNGKHFIVQQNENYQIKNDVWQKIIEIAKKNLGLTTKVETKEQTPQKEITSDTKNEEAVKDLLSNNGIDTNDEKIIKEVLNKKQAITEAAKNKNQPLSDEILNQRLVNYAKGLIYQKQEKGFATSWEQNASNNTSINIDGVSEAISNNSMDDFKAAYHQKAKEYIELYDNADGDGKISIEELITMEEKEIGRNLTQEEKNIIQQEAINRIAILNRDDDIKNLDENEVAAYLWTMSKINDTETSKSAQDITFEEWKTTQESMGILSGSTLSKEESKNAQAALAIVKKTGKTLDELHKTDIDSLNLSNEDKQILKTGLPLIAKDGLTQEMIDKYAKFDQTLKNGYEGLKN